jgi:hypothetical protein
MTGALSEVIAGLDITRPQGGLCIDGEDILGL